MRRGLMCHNVCHQSGCQWRWRWTPHTPTPPPENLLGISAVHSSPTQTQADFRDNSSVHIFNLFLMKFFSPLFI